MPILESSLAGAAAKYVIGFGLLATGGVFEAVNMGITGHSVLAQTTIPTEAQYGIAFGALVLTGWMGHQLLAYHKEQIKELKDSHTREREEAKETLRLEREANGKLIARINELHDELRRQE